MKKLFLVLSLLLVTQAAFAQTYDLKNIWSVTRAFPTQTVDTNGVLNKVDTLQFESNVVPVAGDSMAVSVESTLDSVQIIVSFRVSSPNKIIDPLIARDTLLNSSVKGYHIGTGVKGNMSKQYGRFYITIINKKKLPSTKEQTYRLWLTRRTQ